MTNVNILVVKANWKQYERSKVQKPVAGVAMSHRSVRRGGKVLMLWPSWWKTLSKMFREMARITMNPRFRYNGVSKSAQTALVGYWTGLNLDNPKSPKFYFSH